ncbi:MAG: cyclic pyranopterin monophosphate synthase MoaC [Candidatus Thermoplasmatota archaeon]|jgi:cyclic pyranopterin phosphate synthase|nr:cyclic pyranopterin monophosphate synthase MoaC [Candidatus Thermoplasmatota archaeon]
MIDISSKEIVERTATASGYIRLQESTVRSINEKAVKKGDVLETARVAGISAAKRTWDLIPYCHQIPITSVNVEFHVSSNGIKTSCTVKATYRTGVEMEAVNCVEIALLTIWDMVKYLEKDKEGQYPNTEISSVKVDSKRKVRIDDS